MAKRNETNSRPVTERRVCVFGLTRRCASLVVAFMCDVFVRAGKKQNQSEDRTVCSRSSKSLETLRCRNARLGKQRSLRSIVDSLVQRSAFNIINTTDSFQIPVVLSIRKSLSGGEQVAGKPLFACRDGASAGLSLRFRKKSSSVPEMKPLEKEIQTRSYRHLFLVRLRKQQRKPVKCPDQSHLR